ncbi:MAG: glycosyltransferase family 39 protein [Planctomycetota bacterium]|nr:glycosyltransferase family 39 protein [Planctomycetota bacterium]
MPQTAQTNHDAAPQSDGLTPGLHPPSWLIALIQIFVVAAAGAYMLHHGWDRWNDILVDFGRELYFPWQILQGKVLYRDLASINGPLSPYVNAVWFSVFGVSLRTLILCNLAITAGIVWMVYLLMRTVADRFAATCACLAFVFLCGFSQYGLFGNENYLAPYCHEALHGCALNLASVLCLHRFLRSLRPVWLIATGLLVGLTFLTKVEMFAAAAATAGGTLLLHGWASRPGLVAWLRRVSLVAAAAAVPPVVALTLLSFAMPAREALLNVLGSSRHAFNRQVRSNIYFQVVSGTDHPAESLRIAAVTGLGIAALLAAVALIAWRTRLPRWGQALVAAGVAGAVVGGLGAAFDRVPWPELSRSLCLWMPGLALVGLASLARARAPGEQTPERLMLVILPSFAIAMMLKMFLRSTLNHYGFVLAMPALMVFVVAATGWLPALVARRGGSSAVARAGAVAALAMMTVFHVSLSNQNHLACNTPVGEGADRFYAPYDPAGRVNQLMGKIREITKPDETLAVLPEGVMINYLLRRTNPTPYAFFVPTDLWIFGEENMVLAFAARPPDYIAMVHKDTSNFGLPYFGRHYGQSLNMWVQTHYGELGGIGPKPFTSPEFGVTLWRRNDRQ